MTPQLTTPTRNYRPALMSYTCDAVKRNPDHLPDSDLPLLVSCSNPATVRFTVTDNLFTYAFKRCPGCAEVLRAKVNGFSTLEILSEEAINTR